MSETTIDYHAAGSHFEPERLPLGALLIEDGLINEAQLASALAESTQTGERIGETVVRHGWATEDDIARLLAEQVRLDYLQRASIFFDGEALGRLTREDAQRLEALPTRVRDGRVVVAVSDPTTERLAAVRDLMGQETVIVVVSKSALDAGLQSDLLAGGRGVKSSGDYIEVKHEEEPLQTPELTIVRDEQYEDTASPGMDLTGVIATLDGVAGDVTTLQSSLGELAGRLGEAAAGLGHARDEDRRRIAELTAQTDELTRARDEDQRRIAELELRQAELEESLSQRTHVGESLKAQLADLSRTLDGLG
jgi:hypothetical protein